MKTSERPIYWLLAMIVVVAMALRLHDIERTAIDHFDAGRYALTAYQLASDGEWFDEQAYHAPLGYPWLVSVVYEVKGAATTTGAVLVSALAGVGTCLLMFWLGRRLFGAGVGLAAAALLAVNDFHIAFSKAVLVDSLFTFAFVAALGLLYWAWSSEKGYVALAAGLAVGAAWNVKYNG